MPKVSSLTVTGYKFGVNSYQFRLVPTNDNRLIFDKEESWVEVGAKPFGAILGQGHEEPKLKTATDIC